ncbi:hypothetical protein BT69DRAFT_1337919 [Atractiella rhizophila]|nr:hypothetical protein BT69DRAFT_1337919 [Atractiella rhizophila]
MLLPRIPQNDDAATKNHNTTKTTSRTTTGTATNTLTIPTDSGNTLTTEQAGLTIVIVISQATPNASATLNSTLTTNATTSTTLSSSTNTVSITPTPTPTPLPAEGQLGSKTSEISGGAIAGIAIGSFVALLLLFGLLFALFKRQKSKTNRRSQLDMMAPSSYPDTYGPQGGFSQFHDDDDYDDPRSGGSMMGGREMAERRSQRSGRSYFEGVY